MSTSIEQRTMRKIARRVLPLVFLIYLVAFLDRANVAYAKVTMSADLGFSEGVYGFGAGLFFLGYLVLEIPGALIVHRWGARRWIARILASWGICTALMGFIHTAHQFYAARFLLGLAEAGLVPGVLVYLHEWFPVQFRARAMARFFVASPIALAVGGPIAGAILRLSGGGIPNWRWLFVIEGVPALVLAVVSLLAIADRPEQAAWLPADELAWIRSVLRAEREHTSALRQMPLWRAFAERDILLLAVVGFLANVGIAGFFLWLPSTLHGASSLSAGGAATLSGVPFVVAAATVLGMSHSSDKTGERHLHTAVPLMLAALIFPVTALANLHLAGLVFWLSLSAAAIYGFGPSYWSLPGLVLTEGAAAAAFGVLNIANGLGSFIGPSVVGGMLDVRWPFSSVVLFLSLCFLLAGICMLAVSRRRGVEQVEG